MKNLRGYTLIELVVFLLIGGTLLSMALPSFSSLAESSKATQLTNQFVGLLHYARSEAVFNKRTTGICSGIGRCNTSSTWHTQVLVFNDSNLNGQLDTAEELLRQDALPSGYSWNWSRSSPFLLYERDGTTRALNGTFTLCKQGTALQQVVVSLSGRVRTQLPASTIRCG